MKTCYQHPERTMFAYCDQCARACCDDCCLELFGEYVCERCKHRMVGEIDRGAVQGDAMRSALMAGAGVVVLGFLLGPLAMARTRVAGRLLERTPWLRGYWHIRATWVLGALAVLQGIVWLLGVTVFR